MKNNNTDQPASQEGLTESEDIQPDETENTEEAQEPEISAGIIENGIFTPNLAGVDVEIKAARGDVEGVLKLTVDSYPFVDMAGHWAVKEIYLLAKQGIVKGEYGLTAKRTICLSVISQGTSSALCLRE